MEKRICNDFLLHFLFIQIFKVEEIYQSNQELWKCYKICCSKLYMLLNFTRTITTKNQYYLRIFTHGFEFVGKFNITYRYYLRTTLHTDIIYISESVCKFNITYQLLSTNLYYLPTIIIIIIYIILKILL